MAAGNQLPGHLGQRDKEITPPPFQIRRHESKEISQLHDRGAARIA